KVVKSCASASASCGIGLNPRKLPAASTKITAGPVPTRSNAIDVPSLEVTLPISVLFIEVTLLCLVLRLTCPAMGQPTARGGRGRLHERLSRSWGRRGRCLTDEFGGDGCGVHGSSSGWLGRHA